MVGCSLASGLSFGSSPKGVTATLCFFRFWLGFEVGGDYPLSATIMSKYANKKTRGAFIASLFAMQGFGSMAGGIVALVVATAFEKTNIKVLLTNKMLKHRLCYRPLMTFGALF